MSERRAVFDNIQVVLVGGFSQPSPEQVAIKLKETAENARFLAIPERKIYVGYDKNTDDNGIEESGCLRLYFERWETDEEFTRRVDRAKEEEDRQLTRRREQFLRLKAEFEPS